MLRDVGVVDGELDEDFGRECVDSVLGSEVLEQHCSPQHVMPLCFCHEPQELRWYCDLSSQKKVSSDMTAVPHSRQTQKTPTLHSIIDVVS
jgi:hypothetical protein